MSDKTTMDDIRKTRSSGAFRCLQCFERFTATVGTEIYTCPRCGFEWRLSWLIPGQPRIRGPVWDVNRKLAEEEFKKRKGK